MVIIKRLDWCVMWRDDALNIFHMCIRESPVFRDIRIIEIHPIVNNIRDDVDETRQCIPHKLDTLGDGFISCRHKYSAALIDFKHKNCVHDTFNLSKLPFGLFGMLLNKTEDRCAQLAVLDMQIVLEVAHFLRIFLHHGRRPWLQDGENKLTQFSRNDALV